MTDLGNARDAIRDITLERALGQQIHVFANTISGHYYRRSEVVLGISLAEWRVLRSVLTNPGTSQAEIAVAEGLNVMNVSRAVAGLRRKRLVEAVTDPDDGRRSLLSATELGIEIGADMTPREEMVYREVFAGLSEAELETLDELLSRVTDRLRSLELPDPPEPRKNWAEILRGMDGNG